MAEMTLGTYTFAANPSEIDGVVVQKQRSAAAVDTYEGVAFFSWGVMHKGRRVELSWDFMTAAQYESLRDLYEADASVVWDPQDGNSPATTYTVEITALEGRYHLDLDVAAATYRRDVRLDMLILAEV
jgi:hypothetical protein